MLGFKSKANKGTVKNLKVGLKEEAKLSRLYLKAAETAKAEGLKEAAEFFRKAAKEEKDHAKEIENILHKLKD